MHEFNKIFVKRSYIAHYF